MEKEKLDLSNAIDAEHSKNATAMIGFVTMNIVLAAAYFLEVVKNARTLGSYLIIAALCIVPTICSLIVYGKNRASKAIRFISSIGFMLLYGFVMFTTTSDLAFCYVIVFFVILMVYTDMKLSIGIACYALLVNILVTVKKLLAGTLTGVALTNAEIMLACILLTCVFLILSISKIVQINKVGFEKAEQQRMQSEELLQTVLQVSDTITENIGIAVDETVQLKDSIGLTQRAMEDLVVGTNDTVNAIVEQKDSTDKIDVHIHEVDEAVVSIMEEIRSAEANLDAGNEVMKELLQQVQKSETSGGMVADKMTELDEYANKMQGIMELIGNVADQTGLLALNASIEAARAGEAGRGFAVVASEISSLAAQTNNATGDITKLISNISQSITEVAEAMNELLESSRLQNKYVDDTAVNLKKIYGSTQEIAGQAKQLQTVVDVVMDANSQVMEHIENVSAVTQEVTASANETLESSTVNLESVEKVAEIMAKLGEEADKLQSNFHAE